MMILTRPMYSKILLGWIDILSYFCILLFLWRLRHGVDIIMMSTLNVLLLKQS